MSLASELHDGISALELSLELQQQARLLDYLNLLDKWGKVYNLTAIRGLSKMLSYHLLDSLSLLPKLSGCRRAIDVGSGAGLPGIPLAIAMPQCDWILLDSNSRKTRFIRQAVIQCDLDNTQVVQARVQDYHAPDAPDFVVSRAYASLRDFCDSTAHLMGPNTRLLTMKTGLKAAEAGQLDRSKFAFEEEMIRVPGIDENRSLVSVTRV